ncbi:hypothetical protein CCMA1212_010207 [Trichoderma ghanense]|uniref:Secreted protein n=1 Tax=Trichoderma ghanense TaxID=65468 RepID=A0ABY2GQ50_9HYPO
MAPIAELKLLLCCTAAAGLMQRLNRGDEETRTTAAANANARDAPVRNSNDTPERATARQLDESIPIWARDPRLCVSEAALAPSLDVCDVQTTAGSEVLDASVDDGRQPVCTFASAIRVHRLALPRRVPPA